MAWYRTGTISVTNASADVTGSGTAFIANVGIGEALLGPDGKLYEVESITSDIALVLKTAYAGATAAGQAYAMHPSQSYIRDLAAKAATVITSYGDHIADPTAAHAASAIANTPAGSIAATTVQAAIDELASEKADLASPALTGAPTAPTAAAGTNTTQLATTAFVTTADALKADLASPALTGAPTAPTAAAGTNTTQLATTAFVQQGLAEKQPIAATVAFRAYVSTAQAIAATTFTKVIFGTESYDVGSNFDPVTSEFTAPAAGIYLFSAAISADLGDGQRTLLSLYVNGGEVSRIADDTAGASSAGLASGATQLQLAVADKVTVYIYYTAAETADASALTSYFTGIRIG